MIHLFSPLLALLMLWSIKPLYCLLKSDDVCCISPMLETPLILITDLRSKLLQASIPDLDDLRFAPIASIVTENKLPN
jgi:hypothetical protein